MKGAVSLDVREVLLGAKYADEHLAMIEREKQRALVLAQSYPNAAVRRSAKLLVESYAESASVVRGRRDRALAVIDAVSDPLYRQILELRFVQGQTLEKTAERTHYSYAHLCRKLLPAALAAAQRIVDEESGANSS